MKIALNGATTMRADLQTDIEAAAAASFDAIEIWAAKLRSFLKTNTVTELKKQLDKSKLEALSINSIEHVTFRNPEDYARIKAECEELSQIAAEINCPYVVVVPGKHPKDATEQEIIDESVRVLNELADIAEKHRVKLAFEFLGQTDISVQTVDLSREIVDRVDRSSVGMVIDTFHFYAGDSTFESIERVNPEKLFIFHINDAENLPKTDLTDAHRLYPGLGILPIQEIKAGLDKIGFDRVVSIEIFRPEYWERDPFEVAREARAATIKALNLN
jgi:2-keto-myo-inositol isomerase